MSISVDYIAAGGNRHPSVADWCSSLLAFGAGNNVALWNPNDPRAHGVVALLSGHTDVVNAVKIYDDQLSGQRYIVTGSADKSVRIWLDKSKSSLVDFGQVHHLADQHGSVNAIAVLPQAALFATALADATIKVWSIDSLVKDPSNPPELLQTIAIVPRLIPLTVSIAILGDDQVCLAVAGTSATIQIYVRGTSGFELSATLAGHEGWIRSLDFVRETDDPSSDLLLASASQDKYIRLWRIRRVRGSSVPNGSVEGLTPELATTALSNKAHRIGNKNSAYSITFEALLIGHEDWIYTCKWAPGEGTPTLLSASADNSLAFWTADFATGLWVCQTRLGEISAQKGSTTATGSTGGFWIGLWAPDRLSVVSLGRSGSWRRWGYERETDTWNQRVGISGHTQEVQSIAWALDGSYLLSTSSDQTSRLFAEWRRDGKLSWHEMARPQIHGYDLNCIGTLTSNQFISGADEKLLRVFDKPKAVANLMNSLTGTESLANGDLPDAANIPVLGLSNKAVEAAADDEPVVTENTDDREALDPSSVVHRSTLDLDHPPFEDHLARHTLWPEHEKLYGHGYEISCLATSSDGGLVATACKASSIEHAVIRLYETREWREVKPPLTAHSLTVTSLAFSLDDKYLLSVSRDRQCAVFARDDESRGLYKLLISNPKGHSRMILDCSWAPSAAGAVFATAGRDKTVKLWTLKGNGAKCVATIPIDCAATAVACMDDAGKGDTVTLAYGTEEGHIAVVAVSAETWQIAKITSIEKTIRPSKGITTLRWRPNADQDGLAVGGEVNCAQLAAASDDGSLRLYRIPKS